MAGYSIRAIYSHGPERDGVRYYEERTLLFDAADIQVAFALAEEESRRYLEMNPGFQRVGEWVAFAVATNDTSLSGLEIWSSVCRSELAPGDYYEHRYAAFERPDDDDRSG
jgi:hypothetical protein